MDMYVKYMRLFIARELYSLCSLFRKVCWRLHWQAL